MAELLMSRKTHSFPDRVLGLMREWFPGRSDEHLWRTIYVIFSFEGYDPNTEPTPYVENKIVAYLMAYKGASEYEE